MQTGLASALTAFSPASTFSTAEMEQGHRVSNFGRVGLGHGSVCQTQCLTCFWVLTCAFIVALFLQN